MVEQVRAGRAISTSNGLKIENTLCSPVIPNAVRQRDCGHFSCLTGMMAWEQWEALYTYCGSGGRDL
jgi:hypothetical protein